MNNYDYGDLVRCTGTFTDAEGAAQDPTAVIFQYISPTATTVNAFTYSATGGSITRSATGVYYIDLDADTVGKWSYRFYSTGTGQAGEEAQFNISPSDFD